MCACSPGAVPGGRDREGHWYGTAYGSGSPENGSGQNPGPHQIPPPLVSHLWSLKGKVQEEALWNGSQEIHSTSEDIQPLTSSPPKPSTHVLHVWLVAALLESCL